MGGAVLVADWSTEFGVVASLDGLLEVLLEVLFELLPLSVVQLQASFICCWVEPSCLASCAARHSFCVIWLLPVVSEVDDADEAGGSANTGAPVKAATAAMIAGVVYFIARASLESRVIALNTFGRLRPIG